MVHDAGSTSPRPAPPPPVADLGGRPAPVLDAAAWRRWADQLGAVPGLTASSARRVPGPDGGAADVPWIERVALGRRVEAALVAQPVAPTATLVADALEAAGFGPVGAVAARPAGPGRPGEPWRPGDDELRLGVAGTIAAWLVASSPPATHHGGGDGGEGGADEVLGPTVLAATRHAVLAYARHVEDLALAARRSVGRSALEQLTA